jgi:hypothetical protein
MLVQSMDQTSSMNLEVIVKQLEYLKAWNKLTNAI